MSLKVKVKVNEDQLVDAECLSCGEVYKEELFECLECGSDEVAANTLHEDTYCTHCSSHFFDIWDHTYTVTVQENGGQGGPTAKVFENVCKSCVKEIELRHG